MRTTARPIGWGWSIRALAGFAGLALAYSSTSPALHAQSGTYGQWRTLNTPMPINPVHAALMNNGKVLIVSGSGNVAAETNFRSAVLDPVTENITITSGQPWDMFCNGMVVLYDGRPFINGGNLKYDPFWGQPKNAVFDPVTGLFTDVQNMAKGRWYPTVTTLGDGRVMTFSGLDETSSTNTTVEIYTVGSGWSPAYNAGWTPPLYPRMHLLPDGNVVYTGSGTQTRVFNTTTHLWGPVIATTNYSGTRTYGTSVLLPLRASDGYRPRVMILGGGNPATNTTEVIDMSAPTPQWQYGPNMSQGRIEMNATILPNGQVLATGGSVKDEDLTTQSLNADLFDTSGQTVTAVPDGAGANLYGRVYHSNALLLPDATVLLLGGNPQRGTYEQRMEIYSPAYLFKTDPITHNPIPRPTIAATPGPITYGTAFQIQTPDATDIKSVVLIRPGAPTHAFDMEQRMIELPYSVVAGQLTATAPPNGNIAPPGYYMLFILNSAGVPSVASFVNLSLAPPPPPNQAPTASIDSPTSNVTVNPGDTVAFSGSGSDSDGTIASYAWTFPGGSPASSANPSPTVTYSTPGTYQASLKVTDNGGLTSAAVTRTITVADFAISATPSSNSVAQGGSAGYTATITGGPGFTGTVGLTVTGLPTGATFTLNPTSTVTGSGSTGLTVNTSSTTLPGSYTLTIRGTTSGPVTHTTTVTLVVTVAGDFSIGSPQTQSVANGTNASYSVAITGSANFTSTVSLSVGALPKFVTASFTPASINTSGTSTLTLSTKKQTKPGTYTVTVTGTCFTLVHSYDVTLVVR